MIEVEKPTIIKAIRDSDGELCAILVVNDNSVFIEDCKSEMDMEDVNCLYGALKQASALLSDDRLPDVLAKAARERK